MSEKTHVILSTAVRAEFDAYKRIVQTELGRLLTYNEYVQILLRRAKQHDRTRS